MTKEDKQILCACGHSRAAHAGKGYTDDCGAAVGNGWQFCSCRKFKEAQFKNEEEIEMAKKNSVKKPKGERHPRTQLVYAFYAEKARELRDGDYKDKKNLVAITLRVLCAGRKEGYTFDQMSSLVKEETGSLPTRAQFPLNKLRVAKVLKASKERAAATPEAAKPKKPRKPRGPKLPVAETVAEQAVA